MTDRRRSRPPEPVRESLTSLIRHVMVAALAVGCPTIAVLIVVLGPTDPVVRVGYPPLLVYLLVYTWVLLRRPRQTVPFSRTTLVLFDGAWIVAMLVRLRIGDDVDAAWHSLFPTTFMGLVVFLVVGFLFFSPRTALLHALALVGTAVGVGLIGLLSRPGGTEHVLDLIRFAISLAVVAVLLGVLSRAKARLPLAVAAARIAADEAHEMRDMAYLDPLTGIANRRRLVEELTFQADHVSPTHPVAILYFDLDRFKAVNDRYGHAVGDAVLSRVAAVAVGVVRAVDVVARLGGEEFVVVAPGTDREQATQLAERLRSLLPVELASDPGIPVTASFGVATLRPGESASAALDRVDALMYDAKGAGRDQVISSAG